MEYLQYITAYLEYIFIKSSFKPCYKWNTFNTTKENMGRKYDMCFKPCYKWNTFNTLYGRVI